MGKHLAYEITPRNVASLTWAQGGGVRRLLVFAYLRGEGGDDVK